MPEFAFAGRSNVGKSSLINTLLNRKSFARTSSTPGKTKEIIFFMINKYFYFVDLPGYGYAKVSHQEKENWGERIEEYFESNPNLKILFLLLDIRREPTEFDKQMIVYLESLKINYIIVLTKMDKLSKNEAAKQSREIKKKLKIGEDRKVIPFSSMTRAGKDEIWKSIIAIPEVEKGIIQ